MEHPVHGYHLDNLMYFYVVRCRSAFCGQLQNRYSPVQIRMPPPKLKKGIAGTQNPAIPFLCIFLLSGNVPE